MEAAVGLSPDEAMEVEHMAKNPPPSLVPRIHAMWIKKLDHTNPCLLYDLSRGCPAPGNYESTSFFRRWLGKTFFPTYFYLTCICTVTFLCYFVLNFSKATLTRLLMRFPSHTSNDPNVLTFLMPLSVKMRAWLKTKFKTDKKAVKGYRFGWPLDKSKVSSFITVLNLWTAIDKRCKRKAVSRASPVDADSRRPFCFGSFDINHNRRTVLSILC